MCHNVHVAGFVAGRRIIIIDFTYMCIHITHFHYNICIALIAQPILVE